MSANAIESRLTGFEGAGAKKIYSASEGDPLNRPQGVAVDGFHLFWANGQQGQGTIRRGLSEPLGNGQWDVLQLADNVDEAFGICLSSSRVFYTGQTSEASNLYSIGLGGGVPMLVTESMQQPRGCAFDGDGTVFVADAVGEVYAFASRSQRLGRHRLVRSLKVPGAYGLAVFISCAPLSHVSTVWFALAVLFTISEPFH